MINLIINPYVREREKSDRIEFLAQKANLIRIIKKENDAKTKTEYIFFKLFDDYIIYYSRNVSQNLNKIHRHYCII